MGSLLLELMPSAIGLMLTPAAIAASILLLGSKRPTADSSAFVSAFAVVYGVLSVVVLAFSAARTEPLISVHTKALIAAVVGALLLLAGLGSVVRRPGAGRSTNPGWMARIDAATPGSSFTLGAVLAVVNPNVPILLAGLAIIAASGAGPGVEIVGATFLVVSSVIVMVAAIVTYAVARERVEAALTRIKNWLIDHQGAVNTAVLLVFGAYFLYRGISGL